jgi:signal transduction histidine kinase
MAQVDARQRAPRLERSRHDRWIGGVAGGIAHHIGVQTSMVRVAFVVLSFAAGFGLVVYVLTWLLAPLEAEADGVEAPPRRIRLPSPGRALGIGLVIAGVLVLLWIAGLWFEGNFVWPIVLAAIGFAILWARGDGSRGRWNLETLGTPLSFTRFAIGAFLILAAMGVFLAARTSIEGVGNLLLAMIVALVGAALLAGPWVWSMGRQLVEERSSRVRSEERAEMAAHLHDSVLQTLTLVQKRADDPREVAQLARHQERELRDWLFAPRREAAGGSLATALERAAVEVEEAHRVPIDVVAVGDAAVGPRGDALVAAAREAMVNAAKFAPDAGEVAVYAELGNGRAQVFVRDRGAGFDPDSIPADRRGIRESIVGRMERSGGSAKIRSAPGTGTEVGLEIDLEEA